MIEHKRRFIEIMAPPMGVPEEIAKGHSINGHNEELRAEVRLHGPKSVDHAMDSVIKVEDKMKWTLKRRSGSGSKQLHSSNSFNSRHPSKRWLIPPNRSAKFNGEIRRLSERELQSKKEKGIIQPSQSPFFEFTS